MSDTRARAIEAGARAWRTVRIRFGSEQSVEAEILAAVVDAVEPIIRADERANPSAEVYARAWDEVSDEAWNKAKRLDALRAQVEALPVPLSLHNADCPGRPGYRGICDCEGEQLVRKSDVLALLRGEPE
jgi:hypothetical protein